MKLKSRLVVVAMRGHDEEDRAGAAGRVADQLRAVLQRQRDS